MTSASVSRSIFRVAPVARETTASFASRVAERNGTTLPDFLHHLGMPLPRDTHVHRHSESPGDVYDTNELYFNVTGRQLLADAANVPGEALQHALPMWLPGLGNRVDAPAPKARFKLSGSPSVVGCPYCTVHRTGHSQPLPQYLRLQETVCQRHRIWMLGRHTLHGEEFPIEHASLARTPEILAAHRRHLWLMRYKETPTAFNIAANLTTTWWAKRHPEEKVWLARARRIGRGKRERLWYTLARDAITYPETIALVDMTFEKRKYFPSMRKLYKDIAHRLQRPWLADPSLYPEGFTLRFSSAFISHAHTNAEANWVCRYRHWPTHPIELTQLGYQPLQLTKTEGKSKRPSTKKPKKPPVSLPRWNPKTKTLEFGFIKPASQRRSCAPFKRTGSYHEPRQLLKRSEYRQD